jgi:anti-anti-sigma regulatory factor
MLFAIDMNGIYTMSDGKGLQLHNLKPGQLVGSSIFDLYSAYPQGLVDVRRALAGESFQTTRTVEAFTFDTWYEPLYDEQGALCGVLGIVIDVSERQRAAQEQTRLQEEVIRMQAATLAELSTPLIPLNDQIVVMPLVGGLDTHRVQQVLDTLLSGVQNSRAQVAIIDITGVPVVDTQVANTLLQAAQAVKLLGARVVLTGIRPEVAQTLVGLGVNLGHIVTRGTLQSGISYATQQR